MNEPTVTIPRRHYDDLVNLAECAALVPEALHWGPLAIAETRDTLAEAAQYATDRGRVQSRVEWESRGRRPGR